MACEKTKNIHINMLVNLLLIAPNTVSVNNFKDLVAFVTRFQNKPVFIPLRMIKN